MKQEPIQFKANLFHTHWCDKPKFQADWTVRYIGYQVKPVWSAALKTYRIGSYTFKACGYRLVSTHGSEENEFILANGDRMWCSAKNRVEQIS